MSRAQKKCAEIMTILKETGKVVGDWVPIGELNSKIEIAVGVDKRTLEQYARALCSFGYLKAGTCFNFQILKYPGDAQVVAQEVVQ